MSERGPSSRGVTRRGFLGASALAVASGAAVTALRRGGDRRTRAALSEAAGYRLYPVPDRFRVRTRIVDLARDGAPDPDLAG